MRSFRARFARIEDIGAITEIYNEGIEDRTATFETEHRMTSDVGAWFETALAFVTVVGEPAGEVVGYAIAHPYSGRSCYAGIGEFSVYVRRSRRGCGIGQVALEALIEAPRANKLWKLLSRVFPENRASRALMARMGFSEIGVHRRHGKLDGVWKDNVIVERLIEENLD